MKKKDVTKTFSARAEDVAHQWYIIDAADMVLGRLATTVAAILTGKNKPTYTPHVDTGDYVVVINAEKVHLTGQKQDKKRHHVRQQRRMSIQVTDERRQLRCKTRDQLL